MYMMYKCYMVLKIILTEGLGGENCILAICYILGEKL